MAGELEDGYARAAAATPTARGGGPDLHGRGVGQADLQPGPGEHLEQPGGLGVRTRTTEVRATRLASGACVTRRPRESTTTSSTVCATSLSRWLDRNTVRFCAASVRSRPRSQRMPSGQARVRLRRAAGRRQRLPAQGHPAHRLLAGIHSWRLATRSSRRASPGSSSASSYAARTPTARRRHARRAHRPRARGARAGGPGLVQRGDRRAALPQPATAKTHVGRLLMKLQARDRTQLVVIAYETGLVTPSGP